MILRKLHKELSVQGADLFLTLRDGHIIRDGLHCKWGPWKWAEWLLTEVMKRRT